MKPAGEVRVDMTPLSQTDVRHVVRPLSVFSFCGQIVGGPGDERQRATKDLPLCPECKRYRDKAALLFGGRRRTRN